MTLTMDSLCPHISQSKTRVLKSGMKTSHGITFQELKNDQITFLVTFLGTPFGLIKTPSETSKSRQGGSQSSPQRVPGPPRGDQKGPKTALMVPEENNVSPPGDPRRPPTSPEDVWESFWDPLGSIWGAFRPPNVLGNPKKK